MFYFSVKGVVSDLSNEDLLREYWNAETYFEACRREGQGINSKESIRHSHCLAEIEKRGLELV